MVLLTATDPALASRCCTLTISKIRYLLGEIFKTPFIRAQLDTTRDDVHFKGEKGCGWGVAH
jgi:hypothetical protein